MHHLISSTLPQYSLSLFKEIMKGEDGRGWKRIREVEGDEGDY